MDENTQNAGNPPPVQQPEQESKFLKAGVRNGESRFKGRFSND